MESIHFHIMVPVYKVEKYLDECVRSVLNQNYSDFTLYLVDDGSPDSCGAMCDGWAEKDARIRSYHKPNGGLMHTRRFAIAKAREGGVTDRDYGIFLDSDDSLCPGALETIAGAIDRHDCDCVIYGADRVLEGKTIATLSRLPEQDVLIRDKSALYRIVLRDPGGSYYAMWRKAVRMKLLSPDLELYAPYYHISIGEDVLQTQEIYRNAQSFCFLRDILYHYRVNPASMTQTIRFENYRVDYTVWEYEAAMLREESACTEEDFRAYRSFRIHSFTGELVRIAALETARENKVKLYETIRKTDYWNHFLSFDDYDRAELGKMRVIYEAYRNKNYGLIFLLTKIYRILGKI